MIVPGTGVPASTVAGQTTMRQNAPSVPDGTFLLWAYAQSAANPAVVPAMPSGWSLWQAGQVVGTSQQLAAVFWYKFAASEPAFYDLTGLNSGRHSSFIMPYAGVDLTNPKDVANVSGSSTSGHAGLPAITPVTPGAFVLGLSVDNAQQGVVNTSYSTTTPSGVVDVSSTSTASGAPNCACAELHVPWSSGAVTPVLTPTGTILRSIVCSSALRPAPAAAVGGTFMPWFS